MIAFPNPRSARRLSAVVAGRLHRSAAASRTPRPRRCRRPTSRISIRLPARARRRRRRRRPGTPPRPSRFRLLRRHQPSRPRRRRRARRRRARRRRLPRPWPRRRSALPLAAPPVRPSRWPASPTGRLPALAGQRLHPLPERPPPGRQLSLPYSKDKAKDKIPNNTFLLRRARLELGGWIGILGLLLAGRRLRARAACARPRRSRRRTSPPPTTTSRSRPGTTW